MNLKEKLGEKLGIGEHDWFAIECYAIAGSIGGAVAGGLIGGLTGDIEVGVYTSLISGAILELLLLPAMVYETDLDYIVADKTKSAESKIKSYLT